MKYILCSHKGCKRIVGYVFKKKIRLYNEVCQKGNEYFCGDVHYNKMNKVSIAGK